MKFLDIILGKSDGKLLSAVKDTVDEFVLSKEEKLEHEERMKKLSEESEERLQNLEKEIYEKTLNSYIELNKLDVEDRISARNTEVAVLNSDKANFLNINIRPIIAAVTIIICFIFFFSLVFKKNEISAINENILYTILGGIISHLGTVYNYYFGSSAGSDFKTKLLDKNGNS